LIAEVSQYRHIPILIDITFCFWEAEEKGGDGMIPDSTVTGKGFKPPKRLEKSLLGSGECG
jgi:hypothetical protein